MADMVSDFVLNRLSEWGIHRIYGYPGDGINGLIGAFGRDWDEALAADRPAVIDAITDPDVPPLPPHITFNQARRMRQRSSRAIPMSWGSFARPCVEW
ncbi:MAG: hypothetical protein ACRD2B_10245 [Terriglobia bacterium]